MLHDKNNEAYESSAMNEENIDVEDTTMEASETAQEIQAEVEMESKSNAQHGKHQSFINHKAIAKNKQIDKTARAFFTVCAVLSGIMIVLIFIFVVSRGVQPFLSSYGEEQQHLGEFLTGMRWRPDQGAPSHSC